MARSSVMHFQLFMYVDIHFVCIVYVIVTLMWHVYTYICLLVVYYMYCPVQTLSLVQELTPLCFSILFWCVCGWSTTHHVSASGTVYCWDHVSSIDHSDATQVHDIHQAYVPLHLFNGTAFHCWGCCVNVWIGQIYLCCCFGCASAFCLLCFQVFASLCGMTV